ncbi:MAG: helix-turn-helix domain-containing protein [Bacteroidota bacterium]
MLQHLGQALDLLTTGAKDAPKRHQTLRAAIDWSYTLLNEAECQLFRRLSVFAKGFSLQAVQAVCYESATNPFVAINEIESLAEKGLVERMGKEGRFTLLQTIKDFAMEKLIEAKEEERIQHKHAQYFLEFASYLREGAEGQEQDKRMREGIAEEANTSIALNYLLEKAQKGDTEAGEMGLGICSELWMYWHIRGKHKLAADYITSFLEHTDDEQISLYKCGALFCLQVATLTLGELDRCQEAAIRSYEMAKKINDEVAIGKGLIAMSFGHLHLDPTLAVNYSNEAVAACRALNKGYWKALSLWQNGLLHLITGNLEVAKASYSESFRLFQKLEDNEGKGCAQSGLSMLEFIAGKYEKAIELYEATLAAFKAVGDRLEEARIAYELSWAYLAIKNTETALAQTLESIQAYQEVGSTRGIGLSMNGLAAIEAVRGHHKCAVEIAAAAEEFAQQEGIAVEFGISNHGKVYLDNAKKKLSKKEIEAAEKLGSTYTLKDVLKKVQPDPNATSRPATESAEAIFIKKVEAAIEANLDDPDFGVHQLYEAVSMSQMQVYRKLKALVDQTPSEFIRLYRLQKGRDLLKTTDRTVSEVAYDVGFTDPNYFSRAFQKIYGLTPSEYRK